MRATSAESRAFRREWICAGVTFLVAWFGLTIGAVYVFCKYVWPEGNWLSVLTLLQLLWFSFLGAGAAALGVWWVLNVWHHWRGYYLCPYCGRSMPRKGFCNCPAGQEVFEGMPRPLRRRSVWRHYRKRLPAVLLTYVALIPVAAVFYGTSHRPATESRMFNSLLAHALVCVPVLVLLKGWVIVLEVAGRGSRFRKRWPVFAIMFAAWPLVMVAIMVFRS